MPYFKVRTSSTGAREIDQVEPPQTERERQLEKRKAPQRITDADAPGSRREGVADTRTKHLAGAADPAPADSRRSSSSGRAVATGGVEAEQEEAPEALLFADLSALFRERTGDHLLTADVREALIELGGDRPWARWRNGQPITSRGIAQLLKPLGIRPRDVRTPTGRGKGYRRADFPEARHASTDAVVTDGEADRGSALPLGKEG